MATTAMVETYVRQVLLDEHGDELEEVDGGFELPVGGGVRIWVTDGNHRTRRVLITAPVAPVAAVTPELLAAVNDLNRVTPYGRFFVQDGEVVVEETVQAEDLQPAALLNGIGFVVWAREINAEELTERFGPGPDARLQPRPDDVDLDDRTAGLLGSDAAAQAVAPVAGSTTNAGGYL